MYKIKTTAPLGSGLSVYISAIKTNNGNTILISQGKYFDMAAMIWIPDQELAESLEKIK